MREELAYTRMIKNEIIRDLEKIDITPPNMQMNSEFKAGAETMKKFVIDSLKKKKYE
jgi:hypothetical protein